MEIIRKPLANDEIERSIIPISPDDDPEQPANSIHIIWRQGAVPAMEIGSALQLDTLDRVGDFQGAVSVAVRAASAALEFALRSQAFEEAVDGGLAALSRMVQRVLEPAFVIDLRGEVLFENAAARPLLQQLGHSTLHPYLPTQIERWQHGAGELWAVGQATTDLLDRARRDAFAIVAADAGLKREEHAPLRVRVLERYGATLELAEVG